MPPIKGPRPKPSTLRKLATMATRWVGRRVRPVAASTVRPVVALIVIRLEAMPTMKRPTIRLLRFQASMEISVPASVSSKKNSMTR